MTDQQVQVIMDQIARLDNKIDRLAAAAVTWKVLLALVGIITAVITAGVSVVAAIVG